jgi:hypothetical protein
MAKSRTATADPDTIVVALANHQRTSLGDYTTPVVELPADEARALIASGLATRVEVLS